eukprot:symbB.v1.2.032884.t1/scaffold4009.1/size46459/3
MWAWLWDARTPVAPNTPKPRWCSGDWRQQQYLLPAEMRRAHPPRWPRPEVRSSDFREECYMYLPDVRQWICSSCSLANLLEEDFCRGCGCMSFAARQHREEEQRQQDLERKERAERGQLTKSDVKYAFREGRKMLPPLRGYEEMPKKYRDASTDESYINLLRFAAWKAGHQAQF